jgi:hypothetical protein
MVNSRKYNKQGLTARGWLDLETEAKVQAMCEATDPKLQSSEAARKTKRQRKSMRGEAKACG